MDMVLPVTALLRKQHTLTAVEHFSKRKDAGELSRSVRHYRDLLPLERPARGQQFAFEVDLDACTGCKACVTACHSLNGLDEDETWRSVGLLQGGTPEAPLLQTVTTSCHHCLDPACLSGCPVRAYEKDPSTGIVKHLDDQCIGCKYCTLMCPYDAPKYNRKRGVVRKCDMCSDRLSHGEAPACVQACPNQAISIAVVERESIVHAAEAGSFLPGVAAPEHTLPTTTYKTQRSTAKNALPVDFYRNSPASPHLPLVFMLTFTQLAAGALGVELFLASALGRPPGNAFAQGAFALTFVLAGLVIGLFHLGRPWLAWRAFLGIRTSWLSREALAFAAFAALAFLSALESAGIALPGLGAAEEPHARAPGLQLALVSAGALGVWCSIMVYAATRRAHWSAARTGVKFFGSAILLGSASVLAIAALGGEKEQAPRFLWLFVSGVGLLKLTFEAGVFLHLGHWHYSAQKRVALLLSGPLRLVTIARFGFGFVGGVVGPLVFSWIELERRTLGPAAALVLCVLVLSEILERYLFFSAAPGARMPGGVR